MYAYIQGKLTSKSPTSVVLETGGIGFDINISLQTYSKIEQLSEARLYIHHIQREDVQALFGFFEEEEKQFFGLLLSVSGVGPNTARIILSSLTTREVQNGILSNDVQMFKRVKGVGPKTAQRIIIDLKDKVAKNSGDEIISLGGQDNTVYDEALSALIALGFARPKASGALLKLSKSGNIDTAEELIKSALKLLA